MRYVLQVADRGPRPPATGHARARRRVRADRRQRGQRLPHADPRAAALASSSASAWSPTACRRGCCTSAAARTRSCASSTTSSRAREEVAYRSFPEPTADPAWRFEVKGFDPFREREVETLAHGRQRRDRHARRARRGLRREHAGHLRRRRLRRRHRRPAVPPAGAGPRLDRPAPAGRGTRGQPLQRASSSSTSACSTCATASSTAYWRQRCGSGHTLRVRTARFASLADRQLLAMRAEATPEDFGGARRSGRAPWA